MPSFTITCPAAKWPDAKAYFLKAAPNQTLDENDPVHMTDDEWIKHKILLMVKNKVIQGKRMTQEEEVQKPTDDSFTIT